MNNEHQPLRAEDVIAATVPLHVGLDRQALARDALNRASIVPLPEKTVQQADLERISAYDTMPKETQLDTTARSGIDISSAFVDAQAHMSPQKTPDQFSDGGKLLDGIVIVADEGMPLDVFPDELRAHIRKLDASGLVQLNGLPGTMDPQALATFFAIAEVADYIENPGKTIVAANTESHGEVWDPCRVVIEGKATGPSIPGTVAVPAKDFELLGKSFNCATVAGVLGYINAPHIQSGG